MAGGCLAAAGKPEQLIDVGTGKAEQLADAVDNPFLLGVNMAISHCGGDLNLEEHL